MWRIVHFVLPLLEEEDPDVANHAFYIALVAAAVVIIVGGGSQASGLPNHLSAGSTACRLLALPRRQWQAMLDWQSEGVVSSQSIIALIDAPKNPCLPLSKRFEKSLKRPSGR